MRVFTRSVLAITSSKLQYVLVFGGHWHELLAIVIGLAMHILVYFLLVWVVDFRVGALKLYLASQDVVVLRQVARILLERRRTLLVCLRIRLHSDG